MDLSHLSYRTLGAIQWAFFGLAVIGVGFLIVSAFIADGKRNGFVDACETMGGVPLIGRYNTQACLNPEVLK